MDALGGGQLLHISVLRKQRHRDDGLAVQQGFEVFDQRKTSPFDLGSGVIVAEHGLGQEPLDSPFHAPDHTGCRMETHHFQCADHLVQL